VAISGKSADARDARRLADMSAVQTGLALYCYEGAGDDVDCTAGDATDVVKLDTCTDTAVAAYIALAGIKDPARKSDGSTAVCTSASSALCEYGALLTGTSYFDPCDYTIYARLETSGTTGLVTLTEAGQNRG
jgi:hypothetical protein